MNIYKLENDDINKLDNEFSKTNFGKRAKVFSLLPFFGVIISFTIFIINDILNDVDYIFVGFSLLNLALFGVTQLYYGNMLKEYAQSKKDKE